MSEYGKERGQLDIILKERPAFFIRWGLVVFVVIVSVLLLCAYCAGYYILQFWPR